MKTRQYKPEERWMVVPCDAGGMNPRMHFRDSKETAFTLAQMITRDMGRNTYVAGMEQAFYAETLKAQS